MRGRDHHVTMRNVAALMSYVWHHPSNRACRIHAVGRAVVWQLYKRIAGGYWDVPLTKNRTIRCYPNNASASSVLYARLFDYHEMHFLLRYLRSEDNFLDVGANVGVYTILASSVIDRGVIHAVEPSSRALERLKENILLNNLHNARIHPVAASDSPGKAFLTSAKDSLNHLVSADPSDGVEEVQSVCLDDEVGAVSFAAGKMDIEGAEMLAMRGAINMLRKQNPPVWLIEWNELCHRFGHTRQLVADIFQETGYCLATYDADENCMHWLSSVLPAPKNIIAISKAHINRVDERMAVSRQQPALSRSCS